MPLRGDAADRAFLQHRAGARDDHPGRAEDALHAGARVGRAAHHLDLRPCPASTTQTRSRSALGCGSAETTRATVKRRAPRRGSRPPSTSWPSMTSRSTISPTGASVSRCVLSQDERRLHAEHLRERAPHQRGDVERQKPVMPQPAQVGIVQRAQIGDAVFQHRHPLDPHAEGKALVLGGVDAAIAQHLADAPCRCRGFRASRRRRRSSIRRPRASSRYRPRPRAR